MSDYRDDTHTAAPADLSRDADGGHGLPAPVWVLILAALCGWVAYRLGLFDLWTTVAGPDGRLVRVPSTFAAVDHPFHLARAETLRQALADGHLLRWVGSHQGG